MLVQICFEEVWMWLVTTETAFQCRNCNELAWGTLPSLNNYFTRLDLASYSPVSYLDFPSILKAPVVTFPKQLKHNNITYARPRTWEGCNFQDSIKTGAHYTISKQISQGSVTNLPAQCMLHVCVMCSNMIFSEALIFSSMFEEQPMRVSGEIKVICSQTQQNPEPS